MSNSNVDTRMMAVYPSASHAQNVSSVMNNQNQVVSTMSFNTTSANPTQSTAGAAWGGASITYPNQGPPPAYQEKEEAIEMS